MISCSILLTTGSVRKQRQKVRPSSISLLLHIGDGCLQSLRWIRFECVLRELLPAISSFFMQKIQRHNQSEELLTGFWQQCQFGYVLPQPSGNFHGRNNREKGSCIAGDQNSVGRLAISMRRPSMRRIGPVRATQAPDFTPVPIGHLRSQVAHSFTDDSELTDEVYGVRASNSNFPQAFLLCLCRLTRDFPLLLCRLSGVFPIFFVRLSPLPSAIRVSRDEDCDHDCHDAANRLHPCWPLDVLGSRNSAWVTGQCPSENSAGAECHHCDNRPVSVGPSLIHCFPLWLSGILPRGVLA